jgi:hypothetical protein
MSMDKSVVKSIVDRNLTPLLTRLGLQAWTVVVEFGTTGEEDIAATCLRKGDYEKAIITIDPEYMHDEQHVLTTLRHELLHIFGAPFDLFYEAVAQVIDEKSLLAVRRVYANAQEKLCLSLERMFDSPGMVMRGSCWPTSDEVADE